MAFDKDAFITALDGMSVMELNDLVKAIEEKFGVSPKGLWPSEGSVSDEARSARSGWLTFSSWSVCNVMRDSRKISSFHASSLARK